MTLSFPPYNPCRPGRREGCAVPLVPSHSHNPCHPERSEGSAVAGSVPESWANSVDRRNAVDMMEGFES